jgi:hypothetical protein
MSSAENASGSSIRIFVFADCRLDHLLAKPIGASPLGVATLDWHVACIQRKDHCRRLEFAVCRGYICRRCHCDRHFAGPGVERTKRSSIRDALLFAPMIT